MQTSAVMTTSVSELGRDAIALYSLLQFDCSAT